VFVELQNSSKSHERVPIQRDYRRFQNEGPEMASNDLTLPFSLRALGKLARPKRAFEDAATWTNHVGIVSSEPTCIERRRVREAGYQQDFLSGPCSIEQALSSVVRHFETDRYVFVGPGETSEIVERVPHWSYQSVRDADTAAEWQLATASVADDDLPMTRNGKVERT